MVEDIAGNTAKASTNTGEFDYPLGNKTWNIIEGECKGKFIEMSLTSCNETSFACNNGLCMSMVRNCDMNVDCADKSDESDCDKVIIPKGYRKDCLQKQQIMMWPSALN